MKVLMLHGVNHNMFGKRDPKQYGTITLDGLQRVRGAVLEAGEVSRIRLAGMKPDRQSVIVGGLAVLSAVFDTLGVTSMKPARGGLRVGVLYDLLGRRAHKDVRHATVERVLKRFAVDRDQAERYRTRAAGGTT